MSSIKDLINSLRAMELPKGAESLLSSIATEAQNLEGDRDDLRSKVETRQQENQKLKDRAQAAESERDDLKAKLPDDSSTVLSKADGERWRVLSGIAGELGGVDKVQAQLSRVSELEAERTKAEREATIRAAGYEPKKIARLIGDAALKLEGEGDEQKVLITVGDEDKALSEWAEAEGISDLLNVARLESGGNPAVAQAGRREPPQTSTWAQAADSRFGVKPKTN